MATLTTGQIAEIGRLLRDKYSSEWEEMPITKGQLLQFGIDVDVALESMESSVVSGLPASDAKTWLLANPHIGRDVVVEIEKKRREVL